VKPNPLMLQMGLFLIVAIAAFGIGAFFIHRLRKSLTSESETLQSPFSAAGLPAHSYHSVIQQLKQQKHELTTQQQAERRKAKASDSFSAAVFANLPCGVLFFNSNGLVKQANPTARTLLGFASPVGMRAAELFRDASIRPRDGAAYPGVTVADALAPALSGEAMVRSLELSYMTPAAEPRVFEMTAAPVLTPEAAHMGAAVVISDRTEFSRLRHEQEKHHEVSAEMALSLRNSLTTISGYAQQLAQSRDAELARQLADDIATEASRLDRTIGSFLAGAKSAAAGS
jgi:nitrogen fixation/metabolism regulation signal transduction histidine kinase